MGVGSTTPGNYHDGLKWVFEQMNTTLGVDAKCIAAQPAGEEYRCQFAEHSAIYLHSPMFPLQSEYDAWQIGHVLAKPDPAVIQVMGNNITSRLQANLLGRHPEDGVFLDSCQHHCGAWGSIRIDGDLVATAVQHWYDGIGVAGAKKTWIQGKPYPCKACCSPNE